MTLVLNANRFGGAIAWTAIVDGAKSALNGAIAEGARRAIVIGLACITDLGRATGADEDRKCDDGDPNHQQVGGTKELWRCQMLLHGVSVSTEEVVMISGGSVVRNTSATGRSSICTVGPES